MMHVKKGAGQISLAPQNMVLERNSLPKTGQNPMWHLKKKSRKISHWFAESEEGSNDAYKKRGWADQSCPSKVYVCKRS